MTRARILADYVSSGDELALKAPLASPTFTGNIAMPDDSIDLAHMSANSVDSDQYVDGSIDVAHMSANSVDSDQYVDGSIDLAHMSVNSIDSDQYVDGSIDNAHIADNAIDSEHYAAGSIDNEHLADDVVTLAKMASGTDGNIISYDASGNPVAIATGSDGQVLTSAGAGAPPAFEATAATVGGGSGVDFNDSVKARFGTGNDLEIYHDGTDSIIYDSSDLVLQSDSNIWLKRQTGGGATMLKAVVDGAVELYHDNTKKFETIAGGARIPSGGLLFGSDTAAANALDDYEEGTFTPGYRGYGSAGVDFSVAEQEGHYTKIGRLVNCKFKVTLVDNGDWSLDCYFTGLPFPCSGDSPHVGSCTLGNVNFVGDYASLRIPNGASTLHITMTTDNATTADVSTAHVADAGIIRGSFQYHVA